MASFKLPPNEESIRAALFPEMSPAYYAAMQERHRAEFAAFPKWKQDRIFRTLEEMELDQRELDQHIAELRERTAKRRADNAIYQARGLRNPSSEISYLSALEEIVRDQRAIDARIAERQQKRAQRWAGNVIYRARYLPPLPK